MMASITTILRKTQNTIRRDSRARHRLDGNLGLPILDAIGHIESSVEIIVVFHAKACGWRVTRQQNPTAS